MRLLWKRRKGFTLIEMMVVLAIIGIIAVFVFPSVTTAIEQYENTVWLEKVVIVKPYQGILPA